MAVYAFTSASSSPGVTTTSLGLALLWPRPVVLVEADPTGGSGILAGYFRGIRPYTQGIVELALASSEVAELLPQVAQPVVGTSMAFVAGTRSHTQAAALRGLWEPLAEALDDLDRLGQDVIVDCGRLGLVGWPEPILARADAALLLTRTHLPAISAARSWAESLRRGQMRWAHPGVLLVEENQPYSAREVADVLGLPVIGTLPDDEATAAVLHRGNSVTSTFDVSPLVRGWHSLIAALQATVAQTRADLGTAVSAGVE